MTQGMQEIPAQVRLPARVATEVVLQGIRIRLGRSLVTIMGVVCGIAFLMSILTGQVIRSGVQEEDALRTEVARMENFLLADVGGVDGWPISLLLLGPLEEVERRFLRRQLSGMESRVRVLSGGEMHLPVELHDQVEVVDPAGLLDRRSMLFVMGSEDRRVDADMFPDDVERIVVAATRTGLGMEPVDMVEFIALARELDQEEVDELARQARQDRFRSIWIVVISLLVTVIGISNAMLMSVTERFREIGTMKCLGALSAFIRRIFLLESSLMGFVGGLTGALFGMLFSFVVYAVTYGWGLVGIAVLVQAALLVGFFVCSLVAGVVLSVIAALYPAQVASRMMPAHALRSNV